jgi:hypothetical protein
MPFAILRLVILPLLLSACGVVNYQDLPEGRFDGKLLVMWVGEGSSTSGAGRFVYVPVPGDELRLIRGGNGGTLRDIQPEMMYTDGGSIPRPAQLFNGFSPWGYAPAYMVHDWLFVARHCLTDNHPTPEERRVAAMTFQESAEVIGEAIKSLIESGKVKANDVAPRVIAGAVAGPVSYESWVARGACERVDPAHRIAISAGLPGRRAPVAAIARTLPDGNRVRVQPGQIVASFDF